MIGRLRLAWRAGKVAFLAAHPESFRDGPAFAIRCALIPSDAAVVYSDEDRGIVALEIVYPTHAHSIVLTPEGARNLGAEILNAADRADGTTPLAFIPADLREGS